MTTLSNAITRTEVLIAGDSTYNGVWARTNRLGTVSTTVGTGSGYTAFTIADPLHSGERFGAGADSLAGKHVVWGGKARRITGNDLAASNLVACSILTSSVTIAADVAATVQDGFTKCPPSQRLESNRSDRWFQVRLDGHERLEGYGNGTDRVRQGIAVLVAYQGDFLNDEMTLRAAEDCAAIGAVIGRRENMVAGVNVFRDGESDIHDSDEKGTYQIWRYPYEIIYYRTIREP